MKKNFVSLAEARPDLAKEWNYEKNGDLKPEDVSCWLRKKVWWVQYDKSPINGKLMKLEWSASIDARMQGSNNPIKCGQKVLSGYNDLASASPKLSKEWNYERNGNLKPDMVTYGSGKKVWWVQYDKNPITNEIMKLEWEATVVDRFNGTGNPIKTGQKVLKGYNDLAFLRPDLAKEWNYERNGNLKPNMITCGCRKKVWWIQYDINQITGKTIKLEWLATVVDRIKGHGCPMKAGKQVLKGYNDLATLCPDLTSEWNYEKNGDLKPDMVSCGSGKKVWWVQYDKSPVTNMITKLEWQSTISNRVTNKNDNPFKSGKKVLKGYNDLESLCPNLASEWNYEKNGDLKPDMVTCGSGKKVWWVQYDKNPVTGEIVKLEWMDSISHRAKGRNNPFKNGKKVMKRYNDLASQRPDLASEWNYEKNGDLKPDMVTCNSNKKVWWIQYSENPISKKPIKFEWKDTVNNRNKGYGNPIISNHSVLKGYNDLASLRPDLASEWNYKRNGSLKPDMITCGCGKKVWWIQRDKSPVTGGYMELEWQARISSRCIGNHDNPYKRGLKVLIGYNDFKSLYPDLAKEWNDEKNGDLKPDMITCGCKKKVWWIQYDINQVTGKMIKLEWSATVADRIKGHGCPIKAGKKVLKGYNDLASLRPDLASEWNYEKNGDLKPDMVTCGSGKKAWWIQNIENTNTGSIIKYEWEVSICNRVRGSGNPYLTIYKGEEYIKQYLQKNNITFTPQQKFHDLIGTGGGQLSYDFSILDKKHEYILIEYNGIQHYESKDYFGGEAALKKQKEHDKRKRDYAKKHGYKLITVKYTYDTYESIAEYLDKELKKLGIINDTKKEEPVNDAA